MLSPLVSSLIYLAVVIVLLVLFYVFLAWSWANTCADNLKILFGGDKKKAKCFMKNVMKDASITSTTKANLCEFGRRLSENAALYPIVPIKQNGGINTPAARKDLVEFMTMMQNFRSLIQYNDVPTLYRHMKNCDPDIGSKIPSVKQYFMKSTST